MNPLAGLLRGHSHNGKHQPLSESEAYAAIYGERSNGNHAAPAALVARNGNGRKPERDARGRFLPRS
jgi:hypothetical protein